MSIGGELRNDKVLARFRISLELSLGVKLDLLPVPIEMAVFASAAASCAGMSSSDLTRLKLSSLEGLSGLLNGRITLPSSSIPLVDCRSVRVPLVGSFC